ncbi:MAG: Rne/Rng family ribonuclease [Methylocapsa sp.]|nr:Rne/Rng family ribonuclease [Methylocapsa sp.]
MSTKMLIDASHPEETRVVVIRGNRIEEFDFESASKRQLRGNIYLAKVTRVEPSLQAAFVDYGGNRHGFLAFSEIHPDYYQIPVADRQALIEEEAREAHDEEEDFRPLRRSRRFRRGESNGQRAAKSHRAGPVISEAAPLEALLGEEGLAGAKDEGLVAEMAPDAAAQVPVELQPDDQIQESAEAERTASEQELPESPGGLESYLSGAVEPVAGSASEDIAAKENERAAGEEESGAANGGAQAFQPDWAGEEPGGISQAGEAGAGPRAEGAEEAAEIEQIGGDALEEMPPHRPRARRQYKIQEVIKRRQVLLVQVVKEERGNKGAALTTYLSLAGRYSVLMPNTARGGGISRKITDPSDRKRLKAIALELDVPEGMGVIVRTAGASRTKAEVKRDFEYLLRMWETVRETTLRSTAPTLVYEEGSLIKRSIRDLYNKDIEEIIVAGEEGYREAKEFMRLLMPSHAKMVQPYRERAPIFAKFGVETQLDAMFSNQVTLKSGGYIVINQAEALVAIDVNSGKSTREHNIEDTALRTNLEAVEEISRQLRLRDLAGLIVIDFIDMEEARNNRTVERRLKEALKNDRARIQIGRMSHFGLLEMSRQRTRAGVIEGSTVPCPHCGGAGTVRSTASIALHVLRALEDALIKSAEHDLIVKTRTPVALYILNQKRSHLRDLEERFGASVTIAADETLMSTNYYTLQRGEPAAGIKGVPALAADETAGADASGGFLAVSENAAVEGDEAPTVAAQSSSDRQRESDSESEAQAWQRRRRRRRRTRGGSRDISGIAANAPQPPDEGLAMMAALGGRGPLVPPGADIAAGFASPVSGMESLGDGEAEGSLVSSSDVADSDAQRVASEEQAAREAGAAASGRRPRSRRGQRAVRGRKERPMPEGEAAPEGALGHESEAAEIQIPSPAEAGESIREGPILVAGDALSSGESPSDSAEDAKPETEPARPKRSGWWQRARASLRS